MTLDWWTLGLQTVNVLILVWILARFLFRPVAKIIADRQAAAHAALDEAEAARLEADAARRAAEAERADVARSRAALLEQARKAAEDEKRRLLDEASASADKARAETRADLDRMRRDARAEIADEAGALATDIAARLIARLPDTARIDGFIDTLAEAVRALPDSARAGIGADGPVTLRAARALTRDERAHLDDALAAALGRPVALDVTADPALLAGLELDTPHAVVRNHLAADLGRIKSEFAHHD